MKKFCLFVFVTIAFLLILFSLIHMFDTATSGGVVITTMAVLLGIGLVLGGSLTSLFVKMLDIVMDNNNGNDND